MPEFIHPFAGIAPARKLTDRELARALRLALSAEEEAIHLYEALADAADNALARAVFQEVANEERVHVGEFQRVLSLLLGDEDTFLKEGAGEVDAMLENLATTQGKGTTPGDYATIGNLKGETGHE